MDRRLIAVLVPGALAGCMTVGGPPVPEILECPVIPDTTFVVTVLPDGLPLDSIEEFQSTYLRTETAYRGCLDAVDGYREILKRVRGAE